MKWWMVFALCVPFWASAAIDPVEFTDPELKDRYRSLVMELRCPKCQNQAIGDSDAPIANDMRAKVQELMLQGETDEGIVQWLEDRYGTYIRYRPEFGGRTLGLWLAPPILLLVGLWFIGRVLNRRHALTEDDRRSADALLGRVHD